MSKVFRLIYSGVEDYHSIYRTKICELCRVFLLRVVASSYFPGTHFCQVACRCERLCMNSNVHDNQTKRGLRARSPYSFARSHVNVAASDPFQQHKKTLTYVLAHVTFVWSDEHRQQIASTRLRCRTLERRKSYEHARYQRTTAIQ